MPDQYLIRVPASVRAEMELWDVPPHVLDELRSRLRNHLAADPVGLLQRVPDLNGDPLNLYELRLSDPQDDTSTYIFVFHFLYADDEKHLNLMAADYQRFDQDFSGSGGPVM